MKLYRIKKSTIDKKGRGLYATKNIKAGTKVIDYIGKLITKKQTEESDKYDNEEFKLLENTQAFEKCRAIFGELERSEFMNKFAVKFQNNRGVVISEFEA